MCSGTEGGLHGVALLNVLNADFWKEGQTDECEDGVWESSEIHVGLDCS